MNCHISDSDFCCWPVSFLINWYFLQIIYRIKSMYDPMDAQGQYNKLSEHTVKPTLPAKHCVFAIQMWLLGVSDEKL